MFNPDYSGCCISPSLPSEQGLLHDITAACSQHPRQCLGCCNAILPPPLPLLLLQEYLESRRAARDAAKAAQLNNDLHGLEAEMHRLNLKLWTQVLHQLHELALVCLARHQLHD